VQDKTEGLYFGPSVRTDSLGREILKVINGQEGTVPLNISGNQGGSHQPWRTFKLVRKKKKKAKKEKKK